MNVLSYELHAGFKSALTWALSLGAVGAFFLTVYPVFEREADALMDILRNYPPAVLKALGLTDSGLNTFNAFYSFTVVYPILCACIQALVMGLSVIGKEGARKTSDFLFTCPMRRRTILLNKYGAMLALTLMSAGVYALMTSLAALMNVSALDMRTFQLTNGAYALAQVMSLSIGFCIGCFVPRVKSPVAVGIGLGALSFALLMVDNLSDERIFSFFTPMGYLNPSYIATHSAYDPAMLASLLALTVLLAALGIVRYVRRDIHAA